MTDIQHIKAIDFFGGQLRYKDIGTGDPIVLVHGYLESMEIWGAFSRLLAKDFRLLIPDLPGHGSSSVIADEHSMVLMAEAIQKVLDDAGLKKAFLLGHSMGGYVCLAFLEHWKKRLTGLCLFHSHPMPDTKETKLKRNREIELINEGKKALIYNTNIPNAFADINLEGMRKEIEYAKEIASKTPDDGIKAALRGMHQRPDRRHVLEETKLPFLWILGTHDKYIPYNTIQGTIRLPENGQIITLSRSGHQGFMEEPQKALESLKKFLRGF